MRILLWLFLILIAVVASYAFVPRFSYEETLELPTVETAAGFVGVGEPGEDSNMICPVGIDFLDNATLALLDADTQRILTIDVATGALKDAGALDLPDNVGVAAIAADEGRLWVWAEDQSAEQGAPVALSRTEAGDFAPTTSANGATLSVPERTGPSAEAERRFADLGYTRGEEAGYETLSEAKSARPTPSVETGEQAPPPATFSADGKRLDVSFGPTETANAGEALQIKTAREIFSARLMKTTPAGDHFVSVVSWDPNAKVIDAHEAIYRFPADGSAPTAFDAPLQKGDCVPKQSVAVSDEGEVYALVVNADKVSVVKLEPRPVWGGVVQELDARLKKVAPQIRMPSLSALLPSANAQVLQTTDAAGVASISRADVMRNACRYLNYSWTPRTKNIDINGWRQGASDFALDKDLCACGGSSCWGWKKPGGVTADASRTGLPYGWGAADRIGAGSTSAAEFDSKTDADDDFKRKLDAGRPGGDVCIRASGINDGADRTGKFAAGVDCSGFVQRAWGVTGADRRYATSTLASIAGSIAVETLRPGDVLNRVACDHDAARCPNAKWGGHVRMVRRWERGSTPGQPGARIEMIESQLGSGCNGMCARTYELQEMNNFAALRLKNLATPDPPLASAIVDCRG